MIYFIVGAVLFLAFMYYTFPIIEVIGDSMYPTYKNGEIIIGCRLFRKSKLKKGDVIVYYSPTDLAVKRKVIKRIDSTVRYLEKPFFYCLGDNADESYDSRYYGYFSCKLVVCKIINPRKNLNEDSKGGKNDE